MSHHLLQPVLRYLRRVPGGEPGPGCSDAQLLERFLTEQDETAFELLVRRHGTMVWSLCRRLLRDAHAAEDAFQATFLVLVRKAGSIGKRQAVAGWLHRVAWRIALRARATTARRLARHQGETDLDQLPAPHRSSDPADQETSGILAEEVGRLPEKYRIPVVLCYLQGKTYDEAAQQLGWAKGTLSTRLTRARVLLRNQLTRRGIALSVPLLPAALAVQATVPNPLVRSTLQAVQQSTAGNTAAVLSTQAAALAQGALNSMFLTKLKLTAVVLLILGLVSSGASVLGHRVLAGDQEPVATALADNLEQAQRDIVRLKSRLDLLEKEIAWLRHDLARLRGVRLAWRFEKGKPFFQEMTTSTKQKMKVQNQDINQWQTQTFVFRWTPLEQDAAGNWVCRIKIDSIKMVIEIGQNKITFDSTRLNAGHPLADFFQTLPGLEYEVKITPDYKVSLLGGLKDFQDRLAKFSPQLKEIADQLVGSQGLAESARALFRGLPRRVIHPDESWTETDRLDMGIIGDVVSHYRYTYSGREGALDRIKGVGMMTLEPPGPDRKGTPLPFQIRQGNLDSTEAIGSLWFDRQRGRLDRSEHSVKIQGRLIVVIGGLETQVELSQNQKTIIRVTDRP